MATQEGLKVPGYMPQSQEKIDLVSRNKELEERVLRVLDDLRGIVYDADQRWLAIGRTAIENGFMAVNRAIFQPSRVKLPED